MLVCSQAIGGTRFLLEDLSLQCDTPEHTAAVAMAIATLAGLGIGLPLTIMVLFQCFTPPVHDLAFIRSFGFLMTGYATDRRLFWWEATVLTRKLLVVLIATLVDDPYFAVVCALLLSFSAFALHILVKPYGEPRVNTLETVSLASLVLTQIMSALYLRAELLADQSRITLEFPLSLGLVAINCGAIVYIAAEMRISLLSPEQRLATTRAASDRGAVAPPAADKFPSCAAFYCSPPAARRRPFLQGACWVVSNGVASLVRRCLCRSRPPLNRTSRPSLVVQTRGDDRVCRSLSSKSSSGGPRLIAELWTADIARGRSASPARVAASPARVSSANAEA
jgi:hypothetical protein